MNTVELVQYAWTSAFDIFSQTASNLTQEQADWTPPGIAHSIGTLYWHAISATDYVMHGWCLEQPALVETGNWREKVILSTTPKEQGSHTATIRHVSIDLASMHAYAQEVNTAVQSWLASLNPKELEREVKTPIGDLNLAQVVEVFAIWHLSAHGGEISALKGCQGAQGYPF